MYIYIEYTYASDYILSTNNETAQLFDSTN